MVLLNYVSLITIGSYLGGRSVRYRLMQLNRILIYPLPFKMHVSERLSDFNSRHCDEMMVIPLFHHSNDEVILLKRFCDGAKNDLRGVIYLNNGVTIVLNKCLT